MGQTEVLTVHDFSVLSLFKLTNNLDHQFSFFAWFSGLEDNALIQNHLQDFNSCLSHVGVSGDVIYF